MDGKSITKDHDNIVFRLNNVRKIRAKGGVSFELHIPSMTVEKAQFVAFIGASGCGKSTLLDLLGLVLRPTVQKEFMINPDGGNTQIKSVDQLSDHDLAAIRKSSIGYVLQSGGLLPFLSVKENILLPSRLNGLDYHDQDLQTLTKSLGIHDHINKKPQHLSGGQRQRAAIARSLMHRPPIVLADEPTAAVDKLTALEIMSIFKELTRRMGVTLIMASHDHDLAGQVSDRFFSFQVNKNSDNHIQSTVVFGHGAAVKQ